MKARAQESERLIDWAFREFNNYKLFTAGDKVDDAEVWLGAEPKVPLTVDKDLVVTLPRKARKDMKVSRLLRQAGAGAGQEGPAGRQGRRHRARYAAGRSAARRRRRCRPHGCARPRGDGRRRI